jgi:DNA-directed RNA polymerase specialized sigma24 family protein
MHTLELSDQRAADLYWLAFLLTGQPEPSLDVTLETLDLEESTNPYFSSWMLAWSRRVVIAKALAGVRDELKASARRTAAKRSREAALPPRHWTPDMETTKVQLERALLAIDLFPRCAVVLSVFEGMSLEDSAVLLDADQNLVRQARVAGLRELTRNLATMQGWTSSSSIPYVITGEMQHA